MKFHLIVLSIFVASSFAGITIKEFEDEFHELWSDPNDEKAASEELAKEEASIEEHNLDYENGLSSYSEKLNELSAIPMDEFEAEKEGALEYTDYATGLIETPEEERNISDEDQAYLDSKTLSLNLKIKCLVDHVQLLLLQQHTKHVCE